LSKIPAFEFLIECFKFPVTHFSALLRRTGLAVLALVATSVIVSSFVFDLDPNELRSLDLGKFQLQMFLLGLATTAFFRSNQFVGTIQVQGDHECSARFYSFGSREIRFFAAFSIFSILPGLGLLEATFAATIHEIVSADKNGPDTHAILGYFTFALFALVFLFLKVWIFVRLAPIFGFIAIENRLAVRDSWRLSRDKFWPLFWLLLAVFVAREVIPIPGYVAGAIFFPLDMAAIFQPDASPIEMFVYFHVEMAKVLPSWSAFILPLNIFAQFLLAVALGKIYFSLSEGTENRLQKELSPSDGKGCFPSVD